MLTDHELIIFLMLMMIFNTITMIIHQKYGHRKNVKN